MLYRLCTRLLLRTYLVRVRFELIDCERSLLLRSDFLFRGVEITNFKSRVDTQAVYKYQRGLLSMEGREGEGFIIPKRNQQPPVYRCTYVQAGRRTQEPQRALNAKQSRCTETLHEAIYESLSMMQTLRTTNSINLNAALPESMSLLSWNLPLNPYTSINQVTDFIDDHTCSHRAVRKWLPNPLVVR